VLDVGHWHRDMPGLTAGAKVLATSAGCSRQIIQYGDGAMPLRPPSRQAA
jgi:GMP synthase (glutamine-hydrolysing)